MKIKVIAPSSGEMSLWILSVAKMMALSVPIHLAALATEGMNFKLVSMLS